MQTKMWNIFNIKKKKKNPFTWKPFMECNKTQWLGENSSLRKSFWSLAKKLVSRIWDKHFKVDEIFVSIDILKK